MINGHLSETDMQQYALDPSGCAPELTDHIRTCEPCRLKAQGYQLLFSALSQEPRVGFDFDVAELVLPSLFPRPAPRIFVRRGLWIYLLACLVVAGCLVAGYFYRSRLSHLFKKYILGITTGLSIMAILLIAITLLTISVFQLVEMYGKYQKKINDLNFY